jgi:hypothetical protein
MKKIILAVCLIFFSLNNGYSLPNFLTGSKSEIDKQETELSETSTRSDEGSIWSNSDTSEEGLFGGAKSDDDMKLYAPPPGEEGNPQKIAPMGSSDAVLLLLLGGFWFYWRRSKKEYFRKANVS